MNEVLFSSLVVLVKLALWRGRGEIVERCYFSWAIHANDIEEYAACSQKFAVISRRLLDAQIASNFKIQPATDLKAM